MDRVQAGTKQAGSMGELTIMGPRVGLGFEGVGFEGMVACTTELNDNL